MGFANSPVTKNVLAGYGIRVGGYRWRWGLGLKGGTFPPHRAVNGEFAADSGDFEALPGEDVNGDTCMCALVPQYRDPSGRFAKPGLQPVFQPPTTAALELYRPPEMDLGPLVAALSEPTPVQVTVVVPDSAIVLNLPPFEIRMPTLPAPVVNVEAQTIPAPVVNIGATTVEAPTVNVAAPAVTVSPKIDVRPTPVKIIREKIVGKSVRFFRGNDGKIDKAEVTE